MSERLVPITRPLKFGDIIAYKHEWNDGDDTDDRNLYLGRADKRGAYFEVIELRTSEGNPSAELMTWGREDLASFRLVEDET